MRKAANLIGLNAQNRFDAIRDRATVLYVIYRGKLLAQTPARPLDMVPKH